MSFKKAVAAALAGAAALSLTACGEDTTWAARLGDTTAAAGVYIYYQTYAYARALDTMTSEEENLFDLTIEEKPAEQWINDEAMESLKQYLVVREKFDEYGLTFSDSRKSTAESVAANMWSQYGAMYERNGISESSYAAVVEMSYMNEDLFLAIYGPGGEKEISDDEMLDYLEETYARIQLIDIPLDDAETDEDIEELRALSEQYLEQAAEDDFVDVIHEYEKYSGTYVEVEDEDPLYYDELISRQNSTLPTEAVDAIYDEMDAGDVRIFEDESNIYVIKKFDIRERTDLLTSFSLTIRREIKGTEFSETLDGWVAESDFEINQAAIDRYVCTNIDLTL